MGPRRDGRSLSWVHADEESSGWRPPPGSGMVGSLAATRLVVDYQSEGDTYDDLLNER